MDGLHCLLPITGGAHELVYHEPDAAYFVDIALTKSRKYLAISLAATTVSEVRLVDAVEPAILDEVLRQLDGNRLVAGRWLGLARATVRKMIRKYHPDTGDAEPEGEYV